jgi:hypothetical protein
MCRATLAALAILVSGCAGTVITNDGDRVVLEHDMGVDPERTHQVALKACAQSGKPKAKLIATTNKNPSFKKGFGAQLSTFECTR